MPSPLLIALLTNLMFALLILYRQQRLCHLSTRRLLLSILLYWVACNIAGGLLFGVSRSIAVLYSAEPAWFLMPLVLAPLEYWMVLGPACALSYPLVGVLLLAWRARQ